jgi:chromosome segregation ATPase
MAMEHGQPQEVDLDRTDRLPILQGMDLGGDYGDDAVRMEHPNAPVAVDFVRPPAIDLPSLAESVRSVEERIARQNAEYETLNRSFQRSRESESAASARVGALEQDLAGLRVALDAEKTKGREQEKALNDKNAAVEAARVRVEESLRDSERHRAESTILRDSLAAREANIAQVMHSLGERDAQFAALRAEHGKLLPALQAREKSATQLESELAGTRSQLAAVTADLRSTQENAGSLGAQLKRHEAEVRSISSELARTKTDSTTYMELLQSREWRAGFDQNLFLEMDARAAVADRGRDARGKLMEQIAEQVAAIEKLRAAAAVQAAALGERTKDLKQRDAAHTAVSAKLTTVEGQLAKQTAVVEKLRSEAATQSAALAERTKDLKQRERAHAEASAKLAAQEGQLAKQTSVIEQMRSEAAAQSATLAERTKSLKQHESAHAEASVKLAAQEGQLAKQTSVIEQMRSDAATQSATLVERTKNLKQHESAHTEVSAKLAALEDQLAKQTSVVESLRSDAAAQSALLAERNKDLKQRETAHAEIGGKLTTVEAQCARLSADLASSDKALSEAQAAASRDVQRITEMLAEAERGKSEQAAQLTKLHAEQAAELARVNTQHSAKAATLQAELDAQEQEMSVLMAHLREARRPIEVIEAQVARLNEQVAAKSAQIDTLTDENKKLTATLERTKGALEEREFLIRRLERSESNNANALGRIQTSMERLGSPAATPPAPAQIGPEWQPQFVRVDGERNVMHTLARRTRIGRASTCELQIDSSSVSRHHALVVVGAREAIIEDLNSTNGVIVNSRKVTRHLLSEGDVITLGDIVFKFATQTGDHPVSVTESPPAE